MLVNRFFYLLKPLIPRRLQLTLRRELILRKYPLCADIWPIDEKAGKPPETWSGWPDQKQFALVLTHDVETAVGHEKCYKLAKLEEEWDFRSSFYFVPKRYDVSPKLRQYLTGNGFEVGVHGLYHDGKLYSSKKVFQNRAVQINSYLGEWGAVGFRSPSSQYNLDWIHDLNIEYDASTFDTAPFEPQPDGIGTIFPLWVPGETTQKGYVELPCTLPEDFTLFVLMKENNIDTWKQKLDWVVEKGGMASLITHPDYMSFNGQKMGLEEYPAEYYVEFLRYIKQRYKGGYWHALPKDLARFWLGNLRKPSDP